MFVTFLLQSFDSKLSPSFLRSSPRWFIKDDVDPLLDNSQLNNAGRGAIMMA